MVNVYEYNSFDYELLNSITEEKYKIRDKTCHLANLLIVLDMQTNFNSTPNYIVNWRIGIKNIANNTEYVLSGRKLTELLDCIDNIINITSYADDKGKTKNSKVIIFMNEMQYYYNFILNGLLNMYRLDKDACLHNKNTYSVLAFDNLLELRDFKHLLDLPLEDAIDILQIEHSIKGNWDEYKIRNQSDILTEEELVYSDTRCICLLECMHKFMTMYNLTLNNIPYGLGGLTKKSIRDSMDVYCFNPTIPSISIYKKNYFKNSLLSFEDLMKFKENFFGAYVGYNEKYRDEVIDDEVQGYDFLSSYPYVMLSEKYPNSKYEKCNYITWDIMQKRDWCEYTFDVTLKNVNVKPNALTIIINGNKTPWELLFKTEKAKYGTSNNLLSAAKIEFWCPSKVYLQCVLECYDVESVEISNVKGCNIQYLPKPITETIKQLVIDKQSSKGDIAKYHFAKVRVTSCNGLFLQKLDSITDEKSYKKYYVQQRFLPYQTGVLILHYALRNLIELSKCCDTWLYSDTDSAYGIGWHKDKIEAYNKSCKDKLKSAANTIKNIPLGMAELEHNCKQFRYIAPRRYAMKDNGKLIFKVSGRAGSVNINEQISDINDFNDSTIIKNVLFYTHTKNTELNIDTNGNEYWCYYNKYYRDMELKKAYEEY